MRRLLNVTKCAVHILTTRVPQKTINPPLNIMDKENYIHTEESVKLHFYKQTVVSVRFSLKMENNHQLLLPEYRNHDSSDATARVAERTTMLTEDVTITQE